MAYKYRTMAEISAERVARQRRAFALYLAGGGASYGQIAAEMHCSRMCAWRYVHDEAAARGLQVSRMVALRVSPLADLAPAS